MKSALIGYTGLVGSNISQKHNFDSFYNSTNIEEISTDSFELIVCAGAPGAKWIANKEPAEDWRSINRLISCLRKTRTSKFVLISTIDVYPSVNEVDESSPIVTSENQPYGRHRQLLEQFASETFDTCIMRLPGVFGPGLKKNPIFDLYQNNGAFINPSAIMQFYYLEHIWKDMACALQHNLNLVNIASEPLTIGEIASSVFDMALESRQGHHASQSYDMQTKFAVYWGRHGRYLYSKDDVISDLKAFVGKGGPTGR